MLQRGVGIERLEGDGDFRSDECVELLKEADIIVTNPPFSLFREYVAQLVEYDKDFLIIGNMNAVTYKEVFPLFKDNLMWLGVTRHGTGQMWFRIPNDSPKKTGQREDNGIRYQTIGNSAWFTNLDHKQRHEPLDLYKKYSPENYPKYDNYDAIEVSKVIEIPRDYDGVMGVPITFLGKYCPEQFDIVAFRKGNDGKDLVYTIEEEIEAVERERERETSRATILPNSHQKAIEMIAPSAMAIPGMMNNPKDTAVNGKNRYARILIQKKC